MINQKIFRNFNMFYNILNIYFEYFSKHILIIIYFSNCNIKKMIISRFLNRFVKIIVYYFIIIFYNYFFLFLLIS